MAVSTLESGLHHPENEAIKILPEDGLDIQGNGHIRKISHSMRDLHNYSAEDPKIQSNAINLGLQKMSDVKADNQVWNEDSILKDDGQMA